MHMGIILTTVVWAARCTKKQGWEFALIQVENAHRAARIIRCKGDVTVLCHITGIGTFGQYRFLKTHAAITIQTDDVQRCLTGICLAYSVDISFVVRNSKIRWIFHRQWVQNFSLAGFLIETVGVDTLTATIGISANSHGYAFFYLSWHIQWKCQS